MKRIFSSSTKRIFNDPSNIFQGWFWRSLWYDISAFFNPRQKWLIDKIPNHWWDKDAIIETVLFECVVDYVEKEKGIACFRTDWSDDLKKGYVSQDYVDKVRRDEDSILAAYKYIKEERPKLVEQIEQFDDNYFQYEEELYERDTRVLSTIVKLRGCLWT
jgi:hypothetical protein